MVLECTLSEIMNLDQTDPDALQSLLAVCNKALLNPALWEWALGITIACAAVGAFIGLAKGRWLAGLVWGAALGPIGWAIIAMSKANLPECPECGMSNATSAKACRHCGVNLRVAAMKTNRARFKQNDSGRGW
jgi:ribosomal protein L40E